MLQNKRICESLIHLVGWQQGYTKDEQISEALTESESGMYFQGVHPLLTISNLKSIAPNFDKDVEVYQSDKEYKGGEIVSYNDKRYKCIKKNKGIVPGVAGSNNSWLECDLFSEWLLSKMKSSIMTMVNTLCTKKIVNGTMRSLCENKILYDGTGRMYDTINNESNFVGLELIPTRSQGVTLRIDKIGLQFTKAGIYKIYIMQSGLNSPYKVLTLQKREDNTMEWFPIDDCILPYSGDNLEAGGSWYIGYSQLELPEGSMAINKDYDWSQPPCRGCSRYNYQLWNYWSKYMRVQPFLVNNENLNSISFNEDFNEDFNGENMRMWDIENNIYGNHTNYGLNLQVTIGCDITDFIIAQRLNFANLLGLQLATDLLREMVYNSNNRYNSNSINIASSNEIRYELDGDSSSVKKSGLVNRLELEYKAVSIDTSGISKVCMPCKSNGIKFGVIG